MIPIKEVVSASIGSSRRDHRVELTFRGEEYIVRREGYDGDLKRFAEGLVRLNEDPNVAAIGLGGFSEFLDAAGRRYYFRSVKPYARLVTKKALVDGTGMKGAFEGDVVRYMTQEMGLDLSDKRVLMTSAVDRWGMAMAFADVTPHVAYGDMLYALGIPKMIHSRKALTRMIRAVAPIAFQLPFEWLYEYETDDTFEPKRSEFTDKLYAESDIIAADYKYVIKYMPPDMTGKWVVTNTTTAADAEFLRSRGVELLVTTTPVLEGRSFGTNVMEALMVASEGAKGPLPGQRYLEIMRGEGYDPGVQWLQK